MIKFLINWISFLVKKYLKLFIFYYFEFWIMIKPLSIWQCCPNNGSLNCLFLIQQKYLINKLNVKNLNLLNMQNRLQAFILRPLSYGNPVWFFSWLTRLVGEFADRRLLNSSSRINRIIVDGTRRHRLIIVALGQSLFADSTRRHGLVILALGQHHFVADGTWRHRLIIVAI